MTATTHRHDDVRALTSPVATTAGAPPAGEGHRPRRVPTRVLGVGVWRRVSPGSEMP